MAGSEAGRVYEFGDFRLDATQRRLLLKSDGRLLPLTSRAFDTLLCLVEARGELVDKGTLMKAVWPTSVVEENNLNQNITILRRVLGETPGEHRYIVTIPGRGYRFVASVRLATDCADEHGTSSNRHGEDAKSTSLARAPAALRPSARILISSALILILGSLVWFGTQQALNRLTTNGDTRLSLVPQAPSVKRPLAVLVVPPASVAIMSFANMTGDAANEYLSDGIADELTLSLSRMPGLKVPARTSAFAYKGRNMDAREIAAQLGVRYVLEGSVRSADEDLRVGAQLIDAQTGYRIWSATYDRRRAALFALQDELATAIVKALQNEFADLIPGSFTPVRPTESVEAYRLYLQGNAAWPLAQSKEAARAALQLYEQAIAIDPKFARAYAAMAYLQSLAVVIPEWSWSAWRHLAADAERNANKAVALDPTLPEAHRAMAVVHELRADMVNARKEIDAALSLAPNDPSNRTEYVWLLMYSGQLRLALKEARATYETAPALSESALVVAIASSMLAMGEEGDSFARLANQLGYPDEEYPIPQIKASAALHARRHEEAGTYMARWQRALGDDRAEYSDVMVRAYAALADPMKAPEAIRAIRDLARRAAPGERGVATTNQLIVLCSSLGAIDLAYELVNASLDQFGPAAVIGRGMGRMWIPEMQAFRADPRFPALAERMGWTDYWDAYGAPDQCTFERRRLKCREDETVSLPKR